MLPFTPSTFHAKARLSDEVGHQIATERRLSRPIQLQFPAQRVDLSIHSMLAQTRIQLDNLDRRLAEDGLNPSDRKKLTKARNRLFRLLAWQEAALDC